MKISIRTAGHKTKLALALAVFASTLTTAAGSASAQTGAAPLDPVNCSDGTYIEDPESYPGLIEDCVTLIAIRNHFMDEPANAELDYDSPWTGALVRGRVWSLDIAGLKLSGTIPVQLADLDKLTKLDLSYNNLSGRIPSELGRLSELTKLDLGHNQLSGPIPTTLGNLENLVELDLSENALSGSIPTHLSKLKNLQELFLYKNNLSGLIPIQLGDMNNLENISFSP